MPENIERIDELTLDDFDFDLSAFPARVLSGSRDRWQVVVLGSGRTCCMSIEVRRR